MDYLDNQFSGMEQHCDAMGGGYYEWWGTGEYAMIDRYDNRNEAYMGVDHKIWNGFRGLFNLTPYEAEIYVTKWIQINLKLKPTKIYIF